MQRNGEIRRVPLLALLVQGVERVLRVLEVRHRRPEAGRHEELEVVDVVRVGEHEQALARSDDGVRDPVREVVGVCEETW